MIEILNFQNLIYSKLGDVYSARDVDAMTGTMVGLSESQDRRLMKSCRAEWQRAEEYFGINIPRTAICEAAEPAAKVHLRNQDLGLNQRTIAAEFIVFNTYYCRSLSAAIVSSDRNPKNIPIWKLHPDFLEYIQHFLAAYQHEKDTVDRLGGEQVFANMIKRRGLPARASLTSNTFYWSRRRNQAVNPERTRIQSNGE